MNIRMDDPRSLGADLLADCAGAYTTYGGPVLVIDMGTATTYNYVDEKGAILAGLITTGIGTAAAALASNTAQLPEVQITRPKSILAANTKDAMQAGLYYDCLGGIERTITQFREELDTDFKVVATGGMSRIFDCPLIDIVDPSSSSKAWPRSTRRMCDLRHRSMSVIAPSTTCRVTVVPGLRPRRRTSTFFIVMCSAFVSSLLPFFEPA